MKHIDIKLNLFKILLVKENLIWNLNNNMKLGDNFIENNLFDKFYRN